MGKKLRFFFFLLGLVSLVLLIGCPQSTLPSPEEGDSEVDNSTPNTPNTPNSPSVETCTISGTITFPDDVTYSSNSGRLTLSAQGDKGSVYSGCKVSETGIKGVYNYEAKIDPGTYTSFEISYYDYEYYTTYTATAEGPLAIVDDTATLDFVLQARE